jgi:hypothetical protein
MFLVLTILYSSSILQYILLAYELNLRYSMIAFLWAEQYIICNR